MPTSDGLTKINCNNCVKIDRCHSKDPELRAQLKDHSPDWCDSYEPKENDGSKEKEQERFTIRLDFEMDNREEAEKLWRTVRSLPGPLGGKNLFSVLEVIKGDFAKR